MGLLQKGKFLVDLIYPKSCSGCNTRLVSGEDVLCIKCEKILIPTREKIKTNDQTILNRLWGRIEVESIYNLMTYKKGNRAQHLIYEFKYGCRIEIGSYLGKKAGQLLRENCDFDIVIPLPLHQKKLKKRGFNQSSVFAEALSLQCDIECNSEALVRIKNSDTQTKKSRLGRWNNVEEIFRVSDQSTIKDKRVLLIDDILTTGATLEAAGTEIINSGAKSLSILTIAAAEN